MADDRLITDGYTYVSEAWGSTSWLDHCICSEDGFAAINNIFINYEYVSSDHLPLFVDINTETLPELESNSDGMCIPKVNWSALNSEDIDIYQSRCAEYLSDIDFNNSVFMCKNASCTQECHLVYLDRTYKTVVSSMVDAAREILTCKNKRNSSFHVTPGWNDYVMQWQENFF